MRFRLFAAITCVPLVTWTACSSFDPATTEEPSPDAATSSPDAPADTSAVDAPSDGGTTDPCADAYLCDGFERTTAVDEGWDPTYPPKNGSLAITTEQHHTGDRALRVDLFAADGGAGSSRQAYLRRTMQASYFAISFAVLVPTAPSHAANVLNVILADGRRVFLNYQPAGNLKLYEQNLNDGGQGTTLGVDVSTNAVGVWRTVRFELAIRATDSKQIATVTVDEKAAPPVLLEYGTPQPVVEIAFGGAYSNLSTQEDVLFFDDVVVRTQ